LFRDEYALYRPLQNSLKHLLQTATASIPLRDSQSHPGSKTSSLTTVTQSNLLTSQTTPCQVGISYLTAWQSFACGSFGFGVFKICLCPDSASPSKRTSVSSFHSAVDSDSAASINLNMEQNNVNFHIKKRSKYPHVPPPADQKGM
ncbi:hypothetical protein XENOCAPTIV_025280, partial [Xenoophorus captivus]